MHCLSIDLAGAVAPLLPPIGALVLARTYPASPARVFRAWAPHVRLARCARPRAGEKLRHAAPEWVQTPAIAVDKPAKA